MATLFMVHNLWSLIYVDLIEFMNVPKSIHGIESKLKQEELITEGQAMEE